MTEEIGILFAFGAGLLSFFSPCVLPLIPGYIAFISGVSLDELEDTAADNWKRRFRVALASFFFVAGFSTLFIALGAEAGYLGKAMIKFLPIISKIGAVVIIVFGLHLVGVFRIKWLYFDKRLDVRSKPVGLLGAYLVGLAFAFGWSPCIGPQLASILILAGTSGRVGEGMILLGVYSLGMAIPFLLTGLFFETFLSFLKAARRAFRFVEAVAGGLLILLGLLILTGLYRKLMILTA